MTVKFLIFSPASSVTLWMVNCSTTMVQTEIPQQLLEELPLSFCTDIQGPLKINPAHTQKWGWIFFVFLLKYALKFGSDRIRIPSLRMNSNNSGDPFTFHLPLSSKFYGQIFPSASAVLWVWCWLANVSMLTCEQSNQPLLVTVNMLALSSKQRCTQVQRHRAANVAVDSLRNTSLPQRTICIISCSPCVTLNL